MSFNPNTIWMGAFWDVRKKQQVPNWFFLHCWIGVGLSLAASVVMWIRNQHYEIKWVQKGYEGSHSFYVHLELRYR